MIEPRDLFASEYDPGPIIRNLFRDGMPIEELEVASKMIEFLAGGPRPNDALGVLQWEMKLDAVLRFKFAEVMMAERSAAKDKAERTYLDKLDLLDKITKKD